MGAERLLSSIYQGHDVVACSFPLLWVSITKWVQHSAGSSSLGSEAGCLGGSSSELFSFGVLVW